MSGRNIALDDDRRDYLVPSLYEMSLKERHARWLQRELTKRRAQQQLRGRETAPAQGSE